MGTINLALTDKQTAALKPLFANCDCSIGMVLAQVFDSVEGHGFLIARFVPEKEAGKVQEALGGEAGKMHTGYTVVDCDI
jgi:hypothetical protein